MLNDYQINQSWVEYMNSKIELQNRILGIHCPDDKAELIKTLVVDSQRLCDIQFLTQISDNCLNSTKIIDNNLAAKSNRIQTWLFAIVFITLIALTSFLPLILRGFVKTRFYKIILLFLISFAIGNLCGTSILHLFPEALEIDNYLGISRSYSAKGVLLMFGTYLFYLIEKVSKLFMNYKKVKKTKKNRKMVTTSQSFSQYIPVHSQDFLNSTHEHNKPGNHEKSSVNTISWVIVLSDCLHKLIDGIAIGATFANSIKEGISLSLAILCEEIPHQFGDFAILINSKLSYKRALLYRLLGSFNLFIGLIFGVLLGENFEISQWVCAIAGGMFIYIALVDMMPESNELSEIIEKEMNSRGRNSDNFWLKLKLFFLQNVGIIFGFSLMLIMAIYDDFIEF